MMMHHLTRYCWIGIAVLFTSLQVSAEQWDIPLQGNLFQTAPNAGRIPIQRDGRMSWSGNDSVYSVFFHVDRAADLQLVVETVAGEGDSITQFRIADEKFDLSIDHARGGMHEVARWRQEQSGYVRVDIQGRSRNAKSFAEITSFRVQSDTDDLAVSFVRDNNGGMYYWGRRGPSVHLSYKVPRDTPIRYAYTELTVPKGQDPIGSFYMANGFGQGYFGMQVNSDRERRILFSVWSPFKTDDPRKIPKDQRIEALAHGKGVHVGKFGNEGSGGQSFLVYPWVAGKTYCFLTRVEPDQKGSTVYTSWFREKDAAQWMLIASFRRPKTDTDLRGFHSFLESFNPSWGHIGRRVFFGNVWVCDVDGTWHQCTEARFSVDGTGGGRHRLDFQGGAEENRFFLRNCGFFDQTGKPGSRFVREADQQPQFALPELPTPVAD